MSFHSMICSAAALAMTTALAAPCTAQERPAASDSAPGNPAVKSPDAITWGDLAKGHNSFTATQAMRRLEKAGYRHVRHLKLDADGLWQADAKMNDQAVHVALDYKGNVAEQ